MSYGRCGLCGNKFGQRAEELVHTDCVDEMNQKHDRLRERLDKEEEERGRQYGLRVQAEEQAKEAQAAARSVIAEAHSTLRLCAVPEQIPPFKTPLAPLLVRILYLAEKRDEALAEVERLMALVQHWYEGRARIGAHMTFVDQRFYDAVRGDEGGEG